MRSIPRILFDRSAFHRANFDRLARSDVLRFVKSGAIKVHHTHILLEETVGMYLKERNRPELKRQLPFLLDLCNGKWFKDREEIWQVELVKDGRKDANLFVREDVRRVTEQTMRDRILKDGEFPELMAGLGEKHAEREKEQSQHSMFSSLRNEISTLRKNLRSPKEKAIPKFADFKRHHIDKIGFDMVSKHTGVRDVHAVYKRWRTNKKQYPFFTTFMEGYLYQAYFSMVEVNKRLDPHAQADIEQLSYLNRADIVVSCDAGFMKEAFNVLWAPKGKSFLTTEEFLRALPSFGG